MDQPTLPQSGATHTLGDAAGVERDVRADLPEPKPEFDRDPLSLIAVDANALAGAIWSGQGTDVSKLIADLLRERPAA